mmetsp:Transcript_34808/g.85244  ORF Transcript_34808/g.85244 Transcript_34808/m.85244 type:complete len:80 (+) Transcript_34808:264-503(+)
MTRVAAAEIVAVALTRPKLHSLTRCRCHRRATHSSSSNGDARAATANRVVQMIESFARVALDSSQQHRDFAAPLNVMRE